jgi:tRNA nucleotidyltransferase (CCA-adding enzyme)
MALSSREERPSGEGAYRYSREKPALAAIHEWNAQATLPSLWRRCAEFAVRESARVRAVTKPGEITDLIERIRRHPIGPDGIAAIMTADAGGLPSFLARAPELQEAMDDVTGDGIPENLKGPARGAWLRERRIEAVARAMI